MSILLKEFISGERYDEKYLKKFSKKLLKEKEIEIRETLLWLMWKNRSPKIDCFAKKGEDGSIDLWATNPSGFPHDEEKVISLKLDKSFERNWREMLENFNDTAFRKLGVKFPVWPSHFSICRGKVYEQHF